MPTRGQSLIFSFFTKGAKQIGQFWLQSSNTCHVAYREVKGNKLVSMIATQYFCSILFDLKNSQSTQISFYSPSWFPAAPHIHTKQMQLTDSVELGPRSDQGGSRKGTSITRSRRMEGKTTSEELFKKPFNI